MLVDVVVSPPAPPPPGFFPEDLSLYKRPAWAPKLLTGPSVAAPATTRKAKDWTTEELLVAREKNILRACAPVCHKLIQSVLISRH